MALTDHPVDHQTTQAGWYPDPDHLHHLRYFDGRDWTSHVTHNGPLPCRGCNQDGLPTELP